MEKIRGSFSIELRGPPLRKNYEALMNATYAKYLRKSYGTVTGYSYEALMNKPPES